MPPWVFFLRYPNLYLREFRKKTTKNSERLGRQALLGSEPGTSRLSVLNANHSATGETSNVRRNYHKKSRKLHWHTHTCHFNFVPVRPLDWRNKKFPSGCIKLEWKFSLMCINIKCSFLQANSWRNYSSMEDWTCDAMPLDDHFGGQLQNRFWWRTFQF